MIKIKPYYERGDKASFQREYLRMVAAVVPFYPEDILYDDQKGQEACKSKRTPKQRKRRKNGQAEDTVFAKRMTAYGVMDGSDPDGQLQAEAELAEKIIWNYSKALHNELYQDAPAKGHVNLEKLRELFLLKLPDGKVPADYRFDLKRNTSVGDEKKHEKALYEYVFPYDEFAKLKHTDSHWAIYELVARLGVKVCPYCNRLFTTTVNTQKHKVRPQLDHFRNKKDYPFLALSINNLIPVCGVCNLLKLDRDADLIYPYEECFADEEHVFKSNIPADHTVPALEGIPIAEDDFRIFLERRDPEALAKNADRCGRIENSINALSLDELYQAHRENVSYLYRQRYILTDKLAQDLCDQFPGMFPSVEALKQLFVLMNTGYEYWGDRPLAKLTNDIQAEIDELYSRVKDNDRTEDDAAGKESGHS